jgi:hypothetical protein
LGNLKSGGFNYILEELVHHEIHVFSVSCPLIASTSSTGSVFPPISPPIPSIYPFNSGGRGGALPSLHPVCWRRNHSKCCTLKPVGSFVELPITPSYKRHPPQLTAVFTTMQSNFATPASLLSERLVCTSSPPTFFHASHNPHISSHPLNNIIIKMPNCWMHFESEPDENAKPLYDDYCSCRGDAGYCHISCIVKYCDQKCVSANSLNFFLEQWQKCPTCRQDYKKYLGFDLANAVISRADGKSIGGISFR